MSEPYLSSSDILAALAQRLGAARAAFEGRAQLPPARGSGVEADTEAASEHLRALLSALDATRSRALAWLILTAASAAYPEQDDVIELGRRVVLDGSSRAGAWALRRAHTRAASIGSPGADLRVATNAVVIDITGSARDALHTGVQRVVRETMRRWRTRPEVVPVRWNGQFSITRELNATELRRGTDWSGAEPEPERSVDTSPPAEDAGLSLVIPWKGTLFLPEVASARAAAALQGLAQSSGSRLITLGFDCIPTTSAEAVLDEVSEGFAHYLSVVKHADRVIAISESSAEEFRGFSRMLGAQGLPELDVRTCVLPVDAPAPASAPPSSALVHTEPLVLCVGSHAPHKNHLAVLFCAEQLWREGLRFRLLFVGGSGWLGEGFDSQVLALRRAGRALTVVRGMSDRELWTKYREARFTVFPSLHEGFGLPVAESLAVGTPSLTSNYGSMREIAAEGGAWLVDPRDDGAILAGMRELLLDDTAIARLRAQAAARPARRWDDYADELWDLVCESSTQ